MDEGSTASFSVVATGAPTLTYHWKFNGNPVSGGTTATLTLTNVSDSQAGDYTVVVAGNGSGSVTNTPPAVLTVLNPPVINSQPQNQVVTNGDQAIFSVGANGTNLTYQWSSNSTPLFGETNSVLFIDPVLISDAASYSVVISNPDGSATSTNALLTVVEQQLATSQSIAVPINTCTNLTFTVVTHGTDLPLTYQWYLNGNPVGTDSASYTITDVQFADAGTYSVVVSDSQGASATTMASITVTDPPPVFTLVPTNMTLAADTGQCSKSNVTWVVTATDNCAVSSLVSVPPSGSTFPKGTTTVTNIATDTSNNVTRSTFTVTVIDTQPPIVTVWPTNETLDVNGQCEATVPNLTTQIVAGDNCDTPVYTQFPAAGTSVSLGADQRAGDGERFGLAIRCHRILR